MHGKLEKESLAGVSPIPDPSKSPVDDIENSIPSEPKIDNSSDCSLSDVSTDDSLIDPEVVHNHSISSVSISQTPISCERKNPKKNRKKHYRRNVNKRPPNTIHLSVIRYPPSNVTTRQPLMYLTLDILGQPIKALVDSGASKTFIGPKAHDLIKSHNLTTRFVDSQVQFANGNLSVVSQEIILPLELKNRKQLVSAKVLDSLPMDLLLGLDFLKLFDINIDFGERKWSFNDLPKETHDLESNEEPQDLCNGLLELSKDQADRLAEFLSKELPEAPTKPGMTNLVEHKIDVGNHSPIKQRYYMVSPKVLEAIISEIEQMLKDDVIEKSKSGWSNPIVMIKKADMTYRFCLDFRKLNAVTKKDAYPLPLMDSILNKLRNGRYISKIDLHKGFLQIPLHPDSRELTAFTVPGRGLFQFKRMPFGLTNSPATFQRLLDSLIGPEMEPYCFAYLDDIIIVTSTFEEHLDWLHRVLDKIKNAGLKINNAKCEFCTSQVRYLGFIVDEKGLSVDPDKLSPVVNYPVPRNIKELQRFLGMASWYRRFIAGYATIASPLNKLLSKKHSWKWEEDQQLAFEKLRVMLTEAPILSRPNFDETFVLQTDASNVGIGAVLTQTINNVEYVIAYASRSLTMAEQNYSTTEKECLAVVWAIQKFRGYLEGYEFKVITDHSSLLWLDKLKNPTGRLARWSLALLDYRFQIYHRKGANHRVPDALSRIPAAESPDESTPVDENLYLAEDALGSWYMRKFLSVTEFPERYPTWRIIDKNLYFYRPDKVVFPDEEDLNKWKLVPPDEDRNQILCEVHNDPQSGHLGTEKTYKKLALRYFWPGAYNDIYEYVKRCETCLRCKVDQRVPPGLLGHRVVENPWVVVCADIMGPLPRSKSGYQYILVFQDAFSKWIEIAPLRSANGKTISKSFSNLILNRYGTPKVLITDNGTEFVNGTIESLTQEYGIHHSTTPLYHPQANPVERVNRVLKTMIISYIDQDHRSWDLHLMEFQFAYNNAHHSSLKTTPAFLNYGRYPEPINLLRRDKEGKVEIDPLKPEIWKERMSKLQILRDWVIKNLDLAFIKQSHYYNLHHRSLKLNVGDLVLMKCRTLSSKLKNVSAKLNPRYVGPYKVTKVLSPTVYEISDLSLKRIGKYHIQDLKPYLQPDTPDNNENSDPEIR